MNTNFTDAIKLELLNAQSAEQLAEIFKANGNEISAESAKQLYQNLSTIKQESDADISLDELESITGGSTKDILISKATEFLNKLK